MNDDDGCKTRRIVFNTTNYELKMVKMLNYVCECVLKSLQSCPALCDPVNCSLPAPAVHGTL